MLVWRHLFFSLQEERKKSFLWWCQPSTKNYNTTDEDEQVRTVQDRMGHRWQERWESENESSDVPFSCSHPKLKRSYRIKIKQNPNQLSEDYNRHLEIVVILLIRPRICITFYVHIVHICTMFLSPEGHGRTLGTGGAVFVGDPRVHEGRHGCFNRDMDKKQFLGQWGLCWILCVDGWSVSCNSGRTDGAGIHIHQ